MIVGMTKNSLHILHLEPYDDAVSVRDRLAFIDARFVLLVWPAQKSVLRRKLDLLLVQRQATRMAQRIALVTDDPDVIDYAADLNISVFPNEQAATLGSWKKPRNKVFLPPRDPVASAVLADQILAARGSIPTPAGRRIRRLGRVIVFLGILVAVGFSFFVAAPSATVTITPASDQVFVRVPIIADPNLTDIDIVANQIPATIITHQATSRVTIETSGRETSGTSQSQGVVVFTNTTDQPLVIPLGTIVATGDIYPIRFATMQEMTLPAGVDARVEVPIQALPEQSGAGGNVNPGAITRIESNFADWVSVTNPNATFGGATQERSYVTADDQQRLLDRGRLQLLQNARDELLHQLGGDQLLVPGSLMIIEERPEWTLYTPQVVGETSESLTLDLRANVSAVVIDESLARTVAYGALGPQLPPNLEVLPSTLTFTIRDIIPPDSSGRVSFEMEVSGSGAVDVDTDAVRERIAGVSEKTAMQRMQDEWVLDPSQPPVIETWPGWYNRLPVLPVRITVEVNTP